jgi:hypothetical protein
MGRGKHQLTSATKIGPSRHFAAVQEFGRFRMSAQPVDATQALNLSAGVSNVKVLRGRSLS